MYLNQSHLSRLICRAAVEKPADAGEKTKGCGGVCVGGWGVGAGGAEGQLVVDV